MDGISSREQLTDAQRALLRQRLRGRRKTARREESGIPTRPNAAEAPLSFAQERLWFIQQLEPRNPVYNEPRFLRLRGRVERGLLERVLSEIVRRHAVLRTSFPSRDSKPVQKIHPPATLALPVIDLASLGRECRERELTRRATAEARRPFDLERGPVLRATLVRLAADDQALLLVQHHIVGDAWSTGLLVREFGALYEAFAAGQPSTLPELRVQYADYAAWQRQRLQGEYLDQELEYWRRHLDGAPALLDLPTDRPRPARPSFRGARAEWRLDAEVTGELRMLGQTHGATLFMTLLAGFEIVLARHAGQTDLTLGTPSLGRNRLELESLIGFFINTLVLRADLGADPRFDELLVQARDAALGAQSHQEVPFEKVVEALAPERHLSHTPLFQVWFSLQNVRRGKLDLPGLALGAVGVEHASAKFDLNFALTERDGGLIGSLEYSTDLFTAASAQRLLRHYENVLRAVAEDPGRRFSEIALFDAAEQHELLVELQGRRVARPSANLVERFAALASHDPRAVALADGETELRRGELASRASGLAHVLRRRGIGPGTRVGIRLEHGFEAVTALLAVMEAGAAYVPIDPGHPPRQVAYVVGDAGLELVLTTSALAGTLEDAVEELCLDGLDLPADVDPPARVAIPAEAPAYVMYTSGSTGRPKGVVISHRALLDYVDWAIEHYVIAGDEGDEGDDGGDGAFALYSSLSFDLTVTSLWVPLLAGRRTVIYREREGEPAILDVLRDDLVEVVKLTPSHLELWRGQKIENRRLRRLVVGGEALTAELATEIDTAFEGRVEILNEYGPTEATVGCMLYRFVPGREPGATVPIGRPADNAEIFVLDPLGGMAACQVAGEVAIGGAGLAAGYWNRPALTAERFVPHPTGDGERLYLSGDLGRWSADGELLFLGRRDQQVKYHGYRVELEGIQALLNEHPKVRGSIVLLAEDVLVAYYVSRKALDASELRRFLAERMTEETIPTLFVHLRRLPLTLNGKVNLAALPSIDEARGRLERTYEAPRTPTEELLAEIWAEVLRVERVGVSENFFTLGGHSLLATLVVSRVREAFGVELALRDLFAAPTVHRLAHEIDAAIRAGAGLETPPVEPLERGVRLPLSFSQQRLWFLDRLQPGNPFYNIPSAMRLRGRLDVAALEHALSEIVRRHEILRTVFSDQDGEPAQEIRPARPVRLPRIDLGALPEATREREIARQASIDARRSFDLERGPLLRLALLRAGARDHVLLSNQHHIISDGWSIGLMVREVERLYRTRLAGEPSPLHDLPVQYADYAAWQERYLSGALLEAQLDYWRQQLGGAPPLLELPNDFPRPAMPSFLGAAADWRLEADLAARLRKTAHERGATLFMVLLGAFQVVLGRWAGQDDVSVGTPTAGRHRLELEPLIGFFINTLVLRGDLAGDPAFGEFLDRLRAVSLAAHAHQDVPFEKVVEHLAPERNLSHMPLFQVWFTLQNLQRETLRLPDLELAPVPVVSRTAKFDLNFSLQEDGEALGGRLEYSTDLFAEASARRLLRHYSNVLRAVAEDPERRLSEISFFDALERHELLIERQGTRIERDDSLPARFAALVARRSSAVALVDGAAAPGEATLTYGELAARAQALAWALRERGVGAGSRVGIRLEHGFTAVTALLAVLETGAAYVPIDPGHPPRQAAFVVEDAGLGLVLTSTALAEALGDGIEELCVDDLGLPPGADPSALDPVPAEAPAYVMYTSGSTGRPKGVVISHRALLDYVDQAIARYAGGEEAFALYSSLAFDLTVTSLWVPLLAGGRAVIYRERDGEPAILDVLRDDLVEVVKLTPSHLELWRGQKIENRRLRRLVVGGEALTVELAAEIDAAFEGRVEILNEYGPTETTVGCMLHGFAPRRDLGTAVPIGLPMANAGIHVFDAAGRPAPVLVTGEIAITGRGLAAGYLNRPALTAERFVPHPSEAGGRAYLSGDLGRWSARGELLFAGRRDKQVKYHGYRIELEGIQALLNEHPKVRGSVVILAGETDEPETLLAYYVSRKALPAGDLRAFLAERMIEEMLPSFFVHLRRLPLTLNGKVDEKALPPLHEIRQKLERRFVAPRDAGEEVLAGIWARVLRLERVGVEENFFSLGGHSLVATRLLARVHEAFGVDLPLRSIFEAPTVRQLAAAVEQARQDGGGLATPPLVRLPSAEREAGVVLSSAQERMWLAQQFDPSVSTYHVARSARLSGALDAAALEAALDGVVERHEILRTRFVAGDGGPRQFVDPPLRRALPRIDLRGLEAARRDAEVGRLVARESRRPFDLERGPALRAWLARLDEEEHVFLLAQHHIQTDLLSMEILVEEILTLYAAARAGQPSPLPALDLHYADYAAWQRRLVEGERWAALLDYWRQRLAGAPPELAPPADRPRSPLAHPRAGFHEETLPGTFTTALAGLARDSGATPFMAGLAVLGAVLHQRCESADLVLGTPVAGRRRPELQGVIGCFINDLVLRLDAAGDPGFEQFLVRVRDTVLEADLYQDLPFERLVDDLGVERQPGRNPLYQVQFLLGRPPSAGDGGAPAGLEARSQAVRNPTAKLDLVFAVTPREDALAIGVEYNAELYDAATAAALAADFGRVLETAADRPAIALSELAEVLRQAERERRAALGDEMAGARSRIFRRARRKREVVEG